MSFGRALLVFSAIATLNDGVARGQGELADLKFKYDVGRAELIKPIRELQKNYQSQLEKLRDQVRASGSLEKTEAVDAELKGFREATAPPAGSDFLELARLQKIYATEVTARHTRALRGLPALVKTYKEQLVTLQKKLTQQDRLKEAQKVKEALSQIDETLGVVIPKTNAAAKGRPTAIAVIEATDPAKPFEKGEPIFTNREFVWAAVPKKFEAWQITMQPGGSTVPTQFTVKTPGLVYAVIGPGSEEDFKDDGWKKVGSLHGGEGGKWDYLVMEKPLETGDHSISGKGWFSTRVLLPPSSQPEKK